MSENTPTWSRITARLVRGEDLEPSAAAWAMDEVMTGAASAVQLAGFLVALQAKKVTSGELEALADSMIAHARPVDAPRHAVDIVGRCRGRPRGARRAAGPAGGGLGGAGRADRHDLPVRPGVPPLDEVRGRGAQGSGHPHGDERAGADHEPGPSAGERRRRRGS